MFLVHLIPLVGVVVLGFVPATMAYTPDYYWYTTTPRYRYTTTSTTAGPIRQFTLTASTDHLVRDVTTNVSIECKFNTALSSWQSSLTEISRIRILKVDDYHQWHLVAEVRDNEIGIHLYDNVQGSGRISGDISSAYLRITWPVVTADTFGTYQCDVMGFDRNLDYDVEKSSNLVLFEHNITARDVLELFLREQNRYQHQLDIDMKEMEDKLQSCQQTWETKYDALAQMVNQSSRYNASEPWPEGVYSLLASINGCPESSEWRMGYDKVFTGRYDYNSVNSTLSYGSHLPPYTKFSEADKNYVILTYCTKVSRGGESWPSGSYCIRRYDNYCPSGFSSGYVRMATNSNEFGGDAPDNPQDERYYFCCRSDGYVYGRINLPSSRPFYLYRYGGTCQRVDNMQFQEETITISTEYSSNYFGGSSHPDGDVNQNFVSFNLCYYEPY